MTLLKHALNEMNRTKRLARWMTTFIIFLRALILAALFAGVWAKIQPGQEFEQLVLTILAFVLALALCKKPKVTDITKGHLLLSLEMQHPEIKSSPFELANTFPDNPAEEQWAAVLKNETANLKLFEKQRLTRLITSLALPIFFLFFVATSAPEGFSFAISTVKNVVSQLNRGATLTILSGEAKEDSPKSFDLKGGNIVRVELVAQNMIEIELRASVSGEAKIVELRKHASKSSDGADQGVFQTFQMTEIKDPNSSENEPEGRFKIAFAVSEDVDVFIPAIAKNSVLAEILVKQLPVPKLELSTAYKIEEPWPDDKPLDLRIKVKAENPLQIVRLIITSGKRVSQELVNNIMTDEIFELNTDYQLIVEPYVEGDLSEVEIVAEAVDRAIPSPMVGRSNSLVIRTASAYGRYRQALQTLKEVKVMADEAVSKRIGKLSKEAVDLINKGQKQSEDSPFFDGLDRVQINQFQADAQGLSQEGDSGKLMELSERLNDFLFEHEILDDRDRDRDFFVAIRGLSRVIELDRKKRLIEVSTITARIKDFLDGRHERWTIRVGRLPEKPKGWAEVSKKPFHQTMNRVALLDVKNTKADDAQILISLSRVATDFRVWIEELEALEDKHRAEMESKRQQGLVSARNELVELQKRQGEVSQKLDRAEIQDPKNLNENWPSARMEQNTNIEATRRLEGQLRSLAPSAAERIKVALESMNQTLEAGNAKNFVQAETGSDLAGRLLRQAESAAQKAQRQGDTRGRRRRVTSDNYYGPQIADTGDGDLEIGRNYQVDRRYREAILDEVRKTLSNSDTNAEENRKVLENYLRQVIR